MENNTYTYYFYSPLSPLESPQAQPARHDARSRPQSHVVAAIRMVLQSGAQYFLHPLSARVRIKNF